MSRAAPFARPGCAVAALATALVVACGSSQSGSPGSGGTAPAVTAGNAGALLGGAAGIVAQGGAAAVLIPAGGTSSAGAPAGACHKAGEACTSSLDCCEGSTCNNTAQSPSLNGCHPRCTQNSDCQTGCCLLYTGDTRGICTDAMWCGCGMSGARCGSDAPKCCGDQVCLVANAQQSSYECKKRCSTNSDCPTNCCVAIPNLGASACLDPMYCPTPMP